MKLKRYENNPIITPDPKSDWQCLSTTNPGAWYDQAEQKVKILYRAAGNDEKHAIHLGFAESDNGLDFTQVSPEPVLSPLAGFSDSGCIEDPRIVKFGEYYYITYAARPNGAGKYWLAKEERTWFPPAYPEDFPYLFRKNITASYLAITKDFKDFIRIGRLTDPLVDDRDVILFPEKINGKYYMLHRPMTADGGPVGGLPTPTIWISSGEDILCMNDSQVLCLPKFNWEAKKIGGNTPPIKTDAGWLVLYHGVSGELENRTYRVSSMLLDINDPATVLHRSSTPILEPETDYELNGCCMGGCVFPVGNVVIDGVLYVYYGASDKYCCVATCELQKLVDFTRQFDADGIKRKESSLVSKI